MANRNVRTYVKALLTDAKRQIDPAFKLMSQPQTRYDNNRRHPRRLFAEEKVENRIDALESAQRSIQRARASLNAAELAVTERLVELRELEAAQR